MEERIRKIKSYSTEQLLLIKDALEKILVEGSHRSPIANYIVSLDLVKREIKSRNN
jgi:hypothetical protein